MKLETTDGTSLELLVEGYQFPAIRDDRWDSNWLIIHGRVRHPRGDWAFRDPCLTTFELRELADWFESIEQGRRISETRYFTEPNLEFRYSQDPFPAVEVRLAFESLPPWLSGERERSDGLAISFPMATNDLAAAARSLRGFLAKFPERGGTGGAP